MSLSSKKIFLRLLGFTICILPVAIATLSYFPAWRERGSGALLSGFTVFLLIICIYPIIKALKRLFKSPSVFMIWLFLFVIFMLIDSIAHEMTVISFVGAVSNFFGGILFNIAKKER